MYVIVMVAPPLVTLRNPLQTKRQALLDKPREITVDDALIAPTSVARQHTHKTAEEHDGDGGGHGEHSKKTTKAALPTADIAEVSDRGGRVSDARGGPVWKTRKEFDKAAAAAAFSGKRGGGRGGGRGSGGKQGEKKGGGGGGRGAGEEQGKKERGNRRGGGG
ncbi:unnamed protein product, partial [Ectocarpus sp. 6 AP-2014]